MRAESLKVKMHAESGLQNKDELVALNWFERETKNYAHCLGQEIRETAAE